jgi:hypothetical protein
MIKTSPSALQPVPKAAAFKPAKLPSQTKQLFCPRDVFIICIRHTNIIKDNIFLVFMVIKLK